MRVYFSASQVRRAFSIVPLPTLPGLLTRASLVFCFASSPRLLARASCNLAGSAHPCEFTFSLPKFAKPARSCLMQPCPVCSPVRVYFSASQVRRACSLVHLATLPGLGTFETAHGHLDLPLRSPTSPISHRTVTGASVPTPFFPSCRNCHLSGSSTRSLKPSLATLKATSPTLLLAHRA
ncbi:hypothetical protein CRG98_019915 [Punica granatum]|uniref:Uncharacterized protein n=1 Tax=Punica granatum TaxID=22663 RepID=A0A2I0JTU9_PUNGR|nr:hypothetical protein CRG98_019915 [Punica granatum]